MPRLLDVASEGRERKDALTTLAEHPGSRAWNIRYAVGQAQPHPIEWLIDANGAIILRREPAHLPFPAEKRGTVGEIAAVLAALDAASRP